MRTQNRYNANKMPAAPTLESTSLLKERTTSWVHKDDGEPTDKSGSRWQRFMASRPMLVEPAYLIFSIADRSSFVAHTQFVTSLVEESTLEAKNLTEATGEVEDDIQSEASIWLLYCNLVRTLPAVFVTLIVAAYGDVGGRRPGLLLSNVGMIVMRLVAIPHTFLLSTQSTMTGPAPFACKHQCIVRRFQRTVCPPMQPRHDVTLGHSPCRFVVMKFWVCSVETVYCPSSTNLLAL